MSPQNIFFLAYLFWSYAMFKMQDSSNASMEEKLRAL